MPVRREQVHGLFDRDGAVAEARPEAVVVRGIVPIAIPVAFSFEEDLRLTYGLFV